MYIFMICEYVACYCNRWPFDRRQACMEDTVPHAESADPGEAAEADDSDGEVVLNTGPSEVVAALPHTTEEVSHVDGSKDPKPEIEAKEEKNRRPPDTFDTWDILGQRIQ